MQKETADTLELWGTRLLNAGTVVVLAYFVLFINFSGQGRLWDKVVAFMPPSVSRGLGLAAPQKVAAAEAPRVTRTLIMTEQSPGSPAPLAETAIAAPAVAVAVAAAAPAPAQEDAQRAVPTPHLTSSLSTFDLHSPGTRTSASLASAPAVQSAAAPVEAPAAQLAGIPAAETVTEADAKSKTSYGSVSRGDMMGRAAGPVYNLKGKRK